VILPDINIFVYAYDRLSPRHTAAKAYLEKAFRGSETIGLSMVVVLGFVRLLSNPKVVKAPVAPAELLACAQSWLDIPTVRLVGPGYRHVGIMQELFAQSGASGTLSTDIHLAALAIEQKASIVSNDSDFLRFPQLKVINPLR
jgi:toxin-antitoxin system PIN domain toxin